MFNFCFERGNKVRIFRSQSTSQYHLKSPSVDHDERSSEVGYLNQTNFLWFFSFCIVGLTFKQLKFSSLVGPVELLALVAIVAGLFLTWRSGELSKQIQRISFLGAGFLVFNLGTFWAAASHPETISVRDVLAYLFTFLVLLTFLVMAHRRELDALRIVGSAIGLYLLAAVILAMIPSPLQHHLWYYGVKLQGLSDNPNQTAFLAIVGLSFLTGHAVLSGGKRGRIEMAAAIGCAIGGIFTASGAFTVGLICIVALAIAANIFGKTADGQTILPPSDHDASRWQKAVSWSRQFLSALPYPVVVGISAKLATTLLLPLFRTVTFFLTVKFLIAFGACGPLNCDVYLTQQLDRHGQTNSDGFFGAVLAGDAGQGSSRLELWNRALEVARTSPLVGHGSGAHIPYEVDGVLQKYEAHNTALDIVLVSGIVGLGLICVCLIWTFWSALRAQVIYPIFVILVPIGLYSMLHYTGRQPLFWIAISLAIIIVSQYVPRRAREKHAVPAE